MSRLPLAPLGTNTPATLACLEVGCGNRIVVLAPEIASVYNLTNRMQLARGMIPNEEDHELAG